MSRVIRKRITESWTEIAGADEELLDEGDLDGLDDMEVEEEVIEEPERPAAAPRRASSQPRSAQQPRRRS